MTQPAILITLQILMIVLLTVYIIFWVKKARGAMAILNALESIKQELADERITLELYQKENSDLTIRLLNESRTLRHCYRDCVQYQNDINVLRAKLNMPLIEFRPPTSPQIPQPEVTR